MKFGLVPFISGRFRPCGQDGPPAYVRGRGEFTITDCSNFSLHKKYICSPVGAEKAINWRATSGG